MDTFEAGKHPQRRFNPLTGEWVLVSPHRLQRPWQGRVESVSSPRVPAYDPDCYLCPGNSRAEGAVNPHYEDVFVFSNDYAALLPDVPEHEQDQQGLLKTESVRGECRVICFTPRHDLTLALMSHDERLRVVELWASQTADLRSRWQWVQVFENRGELMGASNPHPHGQIWALDRLPQQAHAEDRRQRDFLRTSGERLLLAYARLERSLGERVVVEEDGWIAVVPYWAVWPYEVLLLPLFPVSSLDALSSEQRDSLASILGRLLARYDNLFETPFPYSMGWHGAPGPDHDSEHWQLHAHFYPPLLRSATVRKFMVGFELLGEPQRDLTPEQAARTLAQLPERHHARQEGREAGSDRAERGDEARNRE